MTKALKDVFDEASRLPQGEQDALAEFLREELASEKRWNELLGGSAPKLKSLAAEALAEDARGETKPFGVDGDVADD